MYQRNPESAIAKEAIKTSTNVTQLNEAAKEALKKKYEKPARESSSAEYLARLFLLLADDNRFKPLKTQMDNNFLMGEHGQYPSDVLAAKILLTDLSLPVVVKPARERVPATDVAFVKQGTEPIGECYACGKKHPGGYKKCRGVNEAARKRIRALVKSGYFEEKSDDEIVKPEKRASRQTPKKGATCAAVEDESEAESEDKKSARSALPTYEELLCQQGCIQ